MCMPYHPAIRELDRRHDDGIDVRLLWEQRTNRLFLEVRDEAAGLAVAYDVEGADGLAAFHEPEQLLTRIRRREPAPHGEDPARYPR